MTAALLAGAVCLVATWMLTGAIRQYALKQQILDHPNERSSHTRPTPRGGGVAMAVVFLLAVLLAGLAGQISSASTLTLVVGGGLVAITGWIDDRGDVPARFRLVAHALAAGLAVWQLGGVQVGGDASGLPVWISMIVTLLGVIWMINLYNFMDGIDGIAAGFAVAVCTGVVLFFPEAGDVRFLCLLLACTAAGFLIWNWQPARIFMGDSGSGLLGFCLAAFALGSQSSAEVGVLPWLMLLGVFLFDATLTLLRRAAKGEKLAIAHRKHAYQRAVQAGLPHQAVSGLVILSTAVFAYLASGTPLNPLAAGAEIFLLGALYWYVEWRRPMYPANKPTL